jgi:hypothetical protein
MTPVDLAGSSSQSHRPQHGERKAREEGHGATHTLAEQGGPRAAQRAQPAVGDIQAVRLPGRKPMNLKINEDWLATILAFVLLGLALIGVIGPSWMKF